MNTDIFIAVYDQSGRYVVALVTVSEYLELPNQTITENCGPLSLIQGVIMAYKESDIAYESGDYWVLRTTSCRFNGYEVYKTGITHSTRCAVIGYAGEIGLNKAIAEVSRRQSKQSIQGVIMVIFKVNMKQFNKKFQVFADNLSIYEVIIESNGSFSTLTPKKYIACLTDFNIFFTYK